MSDEDWRRGGLSVRLKCKGGAIVWLPWADLNATAKSAGGGQPRVTSVLGRWDPVGPD